LSITLRKATSTEKDRYFYIKIQLNILIDSLYMYRDVLDTSSHITRSHVSLCVSSGCDDS